MKKSTVMAAFAGAAVLGTAGAAYAVPEVSNVVMTQRTNSRIVDIGYELAGEAAIVTLSIETNGVAIPDSAVTVLSGDVSTVVEAGTGKSIVWNAGADWPEHSVTNAKARVTAWVTNAPPQVMVIDLSKGTSATEQNPYPVYYYTSLEALPGGVTNDVYKTDMLVMNKIIPSGAYAMGDESTSGASVAVTLTQPFYAGVYEVTQKQWYKVTGADPSQFKNPAGPVERVSYEDIRGKQVDNPVVNWPVTDRTVVTATSFVGKLRLKTGLLEFDLPTDAQWEYACRAGTTTYYNDGISGSASSQLDDLGWWNGISGPTPHTVGKKTPNAWGLYDMHGNVWEWSLDWYQATLEGGDDPEGADSGSVRVVRGGCWSYTASLCRSAIRINITPSYRSYFIGFRLVRTLP